MKRILVLVIAIVSLGIKGIFAAPVGNPLKEPAKGEFMIGYEETFVFDKNVKHNDYEDPHGYRSNQHLAKFSYGFLEGLNVNGEIGLARIKNISLAIPHDYQLAWGAGFNWNIMQCMNSIWRNIPATLPYEIEIGINGRYIGIEADKGEQTPTPVYGAGVITYDESWKEFQTAAWIARDFGPFTPYAALILNWTEVRQEIDISGAITEKTLKDPADLGYVLGFDVDLGKFKKPGKIGFLKDIDLSFEFRGQSERANSITGGISLVWKY